MIKWHSGGIFLPKYLAGWKNEDYFIATWNYGNMSLFNEYMKLLQNCFDEMGIEEYDY
ncbi:MAG: hypothetical protein NTZ74_02665 [Chloroflexi bacterium]|nr:hypothetical protein [Chloroflexota bacterium]